MSTRLSQRWLAKTAAYTIKYPMDAPGTRFSNRGAVGSVTFTLPTPGLNLRGAWYQFEVQANQSLVVAGAAAGAIVTLGNAAANNVGFQVAGAKIGRSLVAVCDGTQWVCFGTPDGFCVNGTEVQRTVGGTALTATAAEMNVLAGVVAGAVSASKGVVVDAQSAIAGLFVALGGGPSATAKAGNTGGVSDPTSTVSGTVQSTEYALNTVTLPANAFNANTRSAVIAAWGTTAANANAKNLKLYFGATAIASVAGSTVSGKDFFVLAFVLRTGASTQVVVSLIFVDTGTAPTLAVSTTLAETDTAAIAVVLKSANTAAAAASATGKGMLVLFSN